MKRTRLTRRSLLAGGMALGSAWLFAGSSSRARFGDFTPRTDPWGPNASDRPISRVLEVFSYGGLSPWDTFYVNPATASTGLQWGTFRTQFQELADQDPRRNGAPLTKPFSLGIELGPATYPLWRPDLFDHLQVLVTSQDLLPPEAAFPYALPGCRLGRPTMTGTGAAVSKAYGRDVPVAFVLEPEGVTPTDNLRASENTGTLGGASRPLRLTVPDAGPDLSVLGRPSAPAQDALLRHYIDEYAARLTWPDDAPAVTRSAAFSDYRITMDRYLNVEAIAGLVGGYDPSDDAAIRGPEPDVFGGRPTSNSTRHCLNLAAYLLAQEQTRYVAVMDFGREHPGGAGYDTHGDHVSGNVEFPATVDIVTQEITKSNMEQMKSVTGMPPRPDGPKAMRISSPADRPKVRRSRRAPTPIRC